MTNLPITPAFVCPRCKGPLKPQPDGYGCDQCERTYPVLCGIPDFRLLPDRYISIEDDRRKGLRLFEASAGRSFPEMLDLYWSMTPEVPPDLAHKFKTHALQAETIARSTLAELDPQPAGALLDVGCQTGGLLAVAVRHYRCLVGVDVAFRWLVIAGVRLREAGVAALLVCANAEHLPFPSDSFAAIAAVDLLEHVVEPGAVIVECRRVAAADGQVYFATNNRYSLLPEPHVNVWGVGWMPRALQAAYVQLVSGRTYRNISLVSARELARWAAAAGFARCRIEPAPTAAPGCLERAQALYNRFRRAILLRAFAPRLQLSCRK